MAEHPDSSNPMHPDDEAPMVRPVRAQARRAWTPPDRRPPASGGGLGRILLVLMLLGSLAFNFVLVALLFVGLGSEFGSEESGPNLTERTWSGSSTAKNKVAVIKVEGVIFEDAPGYSYYQKQM